MPHGILHWFNHDPVVLTGGKKKNIIHPGYKLWFCWISKNRLRSNPIRPKKDPIAIEWRYKSNTAWPQAASGNGSLRPPADLKRKTGQVVYYSSLGMLKEALYWRHHFGSFMAFQPCRLSYRIKMLFTHSETAHSLQPERRCVTTTETKEADAIK